MIAYNIHNLVKNHCHHHYPFFLTTGRALRLCGITYPAHVTYQVNGKAISVWIILIPKTTVILSTSNGSIIVYILKKKKRLRTHHGALVLLRDNMLFWLSITAGCCFLNYPLRASLLHPQHIL